jgi:cation transport protein ChaC
VSNAGHPQYAGKLDMQHAARVVNQARGQSGHNREYVTETLAHLGELGISDHALSRAMALVTDEN